MTEAALTATHVYTDDETARDIALKIQRIGNDEVFERRARGLADLSQKGNNELWRNEELNADPFVYRGSNGSIFFSMELTNLTVVSLDLYRNHEDTGRWTPRVRHFEPDTNDP